MDQMHIERTPWWQHPMIQLVIGVAMIGLTAFAFGELVHLVFPKRPSDAITLVVSAGFAGVFVAMYVAFCRWIERRPAHEFALDGAAGELGAGLGIGIVLFSCVVAVIWVLGGYRVAGTNGAAVLIPALGMALASGFPEEIIFRGVLFRLIEKWLGSWAALALTSALFGAGHLANPGATWLAAVAIALEAGIMLGAIYMITRRLWAAIGVHAAWNFAQGGIYGIAVSGGNFKGLLVPAPTGQVSPLITGGAFGAEASVPAMVVATAFGIGLLVIAHRRGKFVAPSWVRRRQGADVPAHA